MNCWHRWATDTNPSHWAMAVSHLFEIGQRVLEARNIGAESSLPEFNTLLLHQCASLKRMMLGEWEWGRVLWQASTARWASAGLWQRPDKAELIEYPIRENEHNWTCFENLYLYPSYGRFVPGPTDLVEWQNIISDVIGVPRESSKDTGSLEKRCRDGEVRIAIFQRSPPSRAFINLDDVIILAQRLTNATVSVITTNKTIPVGEQARVFSSFDLMISPHGSHLSNMIFASPKHTAIIEVIPVAHNFDWISLGHEMGFVFYNISTLHKPDSDDSTNQKWKDINTYCASSTKAKGVWSCREGYSWNFVNKNILVDLTLLYPILVNAVQALCPTRSEEKT